MESRKTIPNSMVVCGKTFNLASLVNEGTLALQLGNVFNVLKHQASKMEQQNLQIEAIQKKLLEIDTLSAKLSGLQAGQENNVRRLNTLEERQQTDRREAERLRDRIGDLENNIKKVDAMEKRVAEQDKTLQQVQNDFEQLKVDARDALTLSSTVNFFKTELMELQEDVTKVLHQAPQTERLMAQVQHNVEASTDQLLTVSSKTAFMEAAISKISVQVDEFKHLRVDLVNRLNLLENPKVDRIGGLESQSRALSKQVQVLQHNWMSNWGAHEQSMTMLREELMLHIDQLRRKLENVGTGTGGIAHSGEDGKLTFIRMDEEEKAMFRKTLDQHQRDISRLDNKKADAQLVIKILHEKADYPALDKKMDLTTFQEKWDELHALLNSININLDPTIQQLPTSVIQVDDEQTTNAQLASTMESHQTEPPRSTTPFETPSTVPAHSTTPGTVTKQGSSSRVLSTPPPTKIPKSIRYTSSSAANAPSSNPGAAMVAQRRLVTAKGAQARQPLNQVTPTTGWMTAPPGKIRPSTAAPSLPGNPAVYVLGSGDPKPRGAPAPDLALTGGGLSIRPVGFEEDVSNWPKGGPSPSPMRPLTS